MNYGRIPISLLEILWIKYNSLHIDGLLWGNVECPIILFAHRPRIAGMPRRKSFDAGQNAGPSPKITQVVDPSSESVGFTDLVHN